MNYEGSLLVFGMAEGSFFMMDVNVLDVSVIITNAVLLHLQKIKSKFFSSLRMFTGFENGVYLSKMWKT